MVDLSEHPTARRRARGLLLSGAIGPSLFVVAYGAEGVVRPGYSSLQHTISTLSLGPSGWTQAMSFIVLGVLTVAFAAGLRRVLSSGPGARSVPLLFLVAGLGLIALGGFPSDAILGYPVRTPPVVSRDGAIHNLMSLVVFVALPAACFVMARRFASQAQRAWAAYSIATGILAVGLLAMFFASVAAAHGGDGRGSLAGLLERVPTILLGAWQTALALKLVKP